MRQPVIPYGTEWAMLLECASPAFNTLRFEELAHSADWCQLLALAEEHRVLGHLAKRLREIDEHLISAEFRSRLLESHRAQIISTLGMTVELFRILEVLSAKNVAALVVKGPVLAAQAYDDPAVRSYGDVDLLVRQRDIRRATESLESMGFEAAVPLSAIDAGKIPGQYLFSKPDTDLLVELHDDFTLRYFPRRLPLDKLFARRILVSLDGHEAPALAVEDELVYICVHGATHFWERLGWIADVAALVTRQLGINWNVVMEMAQEVGAERMVRAGLYLAADLLGARLPAEVLARVKQDVGAARLAACARKWLPTARRTAPTLFERAVFRLRMRGNVWKSPAYLVRLTLSPTEEDWQGDGGVRDNPLFDMLRRPFRLAQKYSRPDKS